MSGLHDDDDDDDDDQYLIGVDERGEALWSRL